MTNPERATQSQSRVAVVSGASGLIGSRLVPALAASGFTVRRLVRRQPNNPNEVRWDPEGGAIDAASLDGVDVVVNLAGETIGKRWTTERRRRIRDSRVKGTTLLATTMANVPHKPRVFFNASAMGIYGSRGEEVLDETSSHGIDFLASVCVEWEAATSPASAAGIRVVIGRNSLVLARGGGALGPMLPVFSLGFGGRLGTGRQWTSWIARADIVRAILFLLANDTASGPVNLAAPNPVENLEFVRILAAVLRRPALLPVPEFALRALFGKMALGTLLASQRIRPRRLLELGFEFQYPTLEAALREELRAERA